MSHNIPTTALRAALNLSLQRVSIKIAPSELKTSDGEDRINTCTSVRARAHSGPVRVYCLASYSLYLLFTLPNKLDPVGKLPCALICLPVMRWADYTPSGRQKTADTKHCCLISAQ